MSCLFFFACLTLVFSYVMIDRRGFAAASEVSMRIGVGSSIGRGSGMVGSIEAKPVTIDGSGACSAWAPDPVTGYYRPINCTPEIDPVELRQMLLNHKIRSSHQTRGAASYSPPSAAMLTMRFLCICLDAQNSLGFGFASSATLTFMLSYVLCNVPIKKKNS